MIDDRQQELAALYALDLLEGKDRSTFESELREDGKLQELVRELRESSAAIGLSAPQVAPSAELRTRLLDAIRDAAPPREQSLLLRPAVLLPWSIAAALAIGGFWLGNLYMQSRAANSVLGDQQRLSQLEVATAQNELEAERILFNQQLANATQELTQLNQQLVLSTEKIVEATVILGETFEQLDEARSKLTSREARIEELTNQLAAATTLRDQSHAQAERGRFQIATLASHDGNFSDAVAIAVWNTGTQEGILGVDRLPPAGSDKDYQLWLFDPAYPDPVDGGVVAVNPQTGHAQISFKPKQRVTNAVNFAVTLEHKGGAPKAEGPIVLSSD